MANGGTDRMWFLKSIEETIRELNTDSERGLSEEEADARLKKYGPNELKQKKKRSLLQLFLGQLKDALIYVLFGAVVITIFMSEYIDATIILLVIFVNGVLGVVQEVKAGKAIEALQKMTSPKALVKRNGSVREIETEKLVPGDVLILETGRIIAADLRLIESVNLQVEESALTGESVPDEKDANTTIEKQKTPIGDRLNCAFKSTVVTYGRGEGVVVETGMNTEVGKIASILDQEEETKTPLEIRLNHLGKTLGKIAVAICVIIFIIDLLQGRDLASMFLIAVSLAVAAIPEGLAAIVAVVLSIGVTGMSKRNAIVKRLPAVETLGSVNVVCSDKTGTLTQNVMTVTSYFILGEGEVSLEEKDQTSEEAKLLAKAMILSSDATYENEQGTGDPTEIALLIFGDNLEIDRKLLAKETDRVDELAFDSDRKLMSTLVEEKETLHVYTKGAIESLIKKCTHVLQSGEAKPISEDFIQQFEEATENMSSRALRVLAAAYKPVKREIDPAKMEKELVLIGLVGMIDPPRQEVKDAIETAKGAGIKTLMITGDHKKTAFAIAQNLNIAENPEQAIEGEEIDNLSETDFESKVEDYNVFARVSPQQKVQIVRSLRSRGNIVSMTGDGVNDAPSLNAADIGVAMGITGTDVAKNAADIILTDDNYATIISAIEQGRNIYNNIKKSVLFLLASNTGEVVAMSAAILMGMPVPLIATQLLWINLLTDSLPAVALGMDPGDPDVMKEKPRNPKESFFAGAAGFRVIGGGLMIGSITLFAFWYGFYQNGYSPFNSDVPADVLQYARTMSFMTIISCQLFFSLAFRHPLKSIFRIGIFRNKYLIGSIVLGLLLQLIVLGVPVMQDAFKLQMLNSGAWLTVILLGLIPLIIAEIGKGIFIKKIDSSET